MRLLKTLWQRKPKILFVVFAFLITLLVTLPVISSGGRGMLFSTDPDVVYVANTLLYIKSGYVAYYDHPGTPAILLISFFLIPLRIYAKFIQHTPFISWVFEHYTDIFFYLRMLQSILLFISLLILSAAGQILTKKTLPIILLFLILFSFMPFYYLGVVISADTFAFFITSVWLLFLSLYLTRKNDIFLFLLALVAGIAFADRATTFFLLPASLIIIVFVQGNLLQKVLKALLSVAIMIMGFSVGISPTRTHITLVLKSIFNFATSTGVHLSGGRNILNYQQLTNSLSIFFHRDTLAVVIVIIFILLAIVYLFIGKKIDKKIALLVLVFASGAIVLAKFPITHYQITNFIVIAFCGTILLSRFSNKVIYLTIFILLFLVIPISQEYLDATTRSLNQSGDLERFIKDNPSKYASIWEWARVKEFAYLWNRDYTNGIFDDELSKLPDKIYRLKPNLIKIGTSKNEEVGIFDVCWDKLYVQKVTLEPFLKHYPKLKMSVQEIQNTDMFLIRSDHCKPVKF